MENIHAPLADQRRSPARTHPKVSFAEEIAGGMDEQKRKNQPSCNPFWRCNRKCVNRNLILRRRALPWVDDYFKRIGAKNSKVRVGKSVGFYSITFG